MSMSFTLGLIPQVICISCTLNFVQEVYFHTCWCFIIDILSQRRRFEVVPSSRIKAWSKKQHKFPHI